MPRSQVVTVNGKQITVKELKIRELREEVLPKIDGLFSGEDLKGKEAKDVFHLFEAKLTEFFPELTEADIEESYPSEIEGLIEAWVSVNFTGLRKLYRPASALLGQMAMRKSRSSSAGSSAGSL